MTRGGLSPTRMLLVCFGLIILGVGILAFLSEVPADQMTPGQETLLTVADGMIKLSVGAILGLGGSRLVRGKGKYA